MADEERKKRLQELRNKAAAASNNSNGDDSADAQQKQESEHHAATVKFRNYHPQDVALLPNKKRPLGTDGQENGGAAGDGSENAAKSKRVEAEEESKVDIITRELRENKTDEVHIVPKNPNWDLKNQVASKLDRLRRRTQRAIVELLRERVAEDDEEGGDAEGGSNAVANID